MTATTQKKQRAIWVFDRDATGHPFIQLGIKTLREAGLDVTLVDGNHKAEQPKDTINPYHRKNVDAVLVNTKKFTNGWLKDQEILAIQRHKQLGKEKRKIAQEKGARRYVHPAYIGLAISGILAQLTSSYYSLLRKVFRQIGIIRKDTTELWWAYIRGFFALARVKGDIMIASRPQVLGAAWFLARLTGKRLVYYPFELYGHQAAPATRFILVQEHLILRLGVDAMITQNEQRAGVYRKRGARKITLVRNFKPFRVAGAGGKLRQALNISEDKKIVLYEGGLIPGRCLDKLAQAANLLDEDCVLVMMGPTKKVWEQTHDEHTAEPIANGKLIIAPPVPHDELLDYVADADAGVIIYDGVLLNNRYCEPGKLSDYVFSSLPIVAPDFPSISPIIQGANIGENFDEQDPKSIAKAINTVLANGKESYQERLENLAPDVSWASQRQTFLEAATGLPVDKLERPAPTPTLVKSAPAREKVDILILIEHVDRELDIACLLKARIEMSSPKMKVRIANFYTEARDLIETVDPDVIVSPFFYGTDDLVLRDYVTTWAEKRWFNLAWEQILYGTQQALKRPRDSFTRNRVQHLAWSEWYKDYLIANGVAEGSVHWLGHSLYDLYSPEYQSYYLSRADLAKRYKLDINKRWVFFPENYRWAFMHDAKLQRLSEKGGADLEELRSQTAYCIEALDASAQWLAAAARSGEVEAILRPRPAVNTKQMRAVVEKAVGEMPPNFHIFKQESVREWVLASDVIVSSNSTSLIEAAVADKPIFLTAPIKMPDCLFYEWCSLVPELRNEKAFVETCLADAPDMSGTRKVREWAAESFKVGQQPIESIAQLLIKMAAEAPEPGPRMVPRTAEASPFWLRSVTPLVGLETRHKLRAKHQPNYFFSYETHEKDLFGSNEVKRRTNAWARVLRRALRKSEKDAA